jgi:DNA invertase Pin-like site-specific DNA recombinase
MTDAVSYLRVSGLGQSDGDGFPRQRLAIQTYALANDIRIVEEFSDDGVPGKTEMQNRPGLAACMARVETNCVKLVLVEISDRLARDAMVSEIIIREFQKMGVRVIAVSGGVDLTAGDDSNPTAKLIRQILAAVSEFDRCIIVNKTRVARERLRLKNGKCEGRKSFGVRPGEESTLQKILELRAKGQNNWQIADNLNYMELPARYGGKWHGATVSKILKRHTGFMGSSQTGKED